MRGLAPLHGVEAGAAGLVLQDPFAGELTVLDLLEYLAHLGAGVVVDDALAAGDIAILGGVGDAVAHAGDTLLVHQVDDQLELVQAFEVGHLGLVPGIDQGLETGAHQLAGAAAKHYLLTEKIGFGLFGEIRLDDAGAGGADSLGVSQSQILCLAAGVLVDGEEGGNAAHFRRLAQNQVAGALGCNHDHVDVGRRHDLVEVDIEAVGEHQHITGLEAGSDLLAVGLRLGMVRRQNHDHVGGLGGLVDGHDREPGGFSFFPAGAGLTQADDDLDARFVQIQRVGVALAAVADDGDGLVLDQIQICVFIVIHKLSLTGDVRFLCFLICKSGPSSPLFPIN